MGRENGRVRASRLVSLVLLLQARGTMTAAELAQELEVSERTVYRDVLALSGAGIPVYAEQGRRGGYRLVDGYRTRLTGLSRAEAEALFLSGLPGPAEDMGLADAVATARLKVLAALPPSLQDAPARTGQRFHLDVGGWFGDAEPPPLLAALARAVWQDETVVLRYRRDREVTRTADPYGLVLKGGIWYLVALVGGDYRTYRVGRVTAVEPTGVSFERDETFDLRGFWAERAAQFVESLLTDAVTIRLSPAGARALRYSVEPPAARWALEAAGEPDERGWVVTRLPVESVDVAYTQLLRLGPEVEVLDPAELRERMAEAARRMGLLYRR
ncbi:Predicted DNA-binding transcriptional regulator YafY, contains an HTH and WYL domains [Thermomonospora echinospora]|uniref:Predicted DNA-binding transcriptional regulator YafY, contains an HTH and WYL domains n=1 Tax=Thermomonospora echinospora TaxID=1992 RepID=A0A1H5V3S9_9ACTN|nr:Predicted DNA-binding transcriptional regulator YafY, contains an HTH and WYL domains [Thermomonospora echinospora]